MKRTVLILILVLTLMSTFVSAAALDYSDTKGHWAEDTIRENTFTGLWEENSAFQPNRAITRIEFARMLHSALGIEIMYFRAPDIKEFFADVENNEPGASELYDLVISNVIPKADTFRPNDTLRRDEMIHYIINGLKFKTNGEYALIKMMPAPFADDEKITPIYKNDVIEAQLLQIIKGREDNMLWPDAPASRAEGTVAVSRLLQVLKNLAKVDVAATASLSDDRIEMVLTITNNTDKAIEILHTSGQAYDFKLFDSKGNNLYTWSADKLFLAALTTTTIEPGETVTYTELLDGDAYASIKDSIYSMKAFIVGTSDSFNVNADGYEFIIESPAEKIID